MEINKKYKVIFAQNRYGEYFIPEGTEHRPASNTILRGEVWEPETIEFIHHCQPKGDIIHAGSFFGDFLPAFSTALLEGNVLWAFEPNQENFFCAKLTVKINHLTNVRLLNYGLGAETTQLPQRQIDRKTKLKLGGASRIYNDFAKAKKGCFQLVPIIRGADVIGLRDVSIIHLDVEGFEQPALMGLLPILRQHRPILILESLPTEDFMRQFLFTLGYKFLHKLHNNFVFQV